MRRILVFSALLSLLPLATYAEFDFVVSRGVWLSDKNALAGDKVKLYTVINNNEFSNLTTQVQFFNSGTLIGTVQVNNLAREEARQIALEYTLPAGKYTIAVALVNAVGQTATGEAKNLSEVELKASQTSAPLDIDLDTDRDRVGNRVDTDDDNDGLVDVKEIEKGTDPLKSDTDSDGLTDSEESGSGTNPLKSDTDGDGLADKDEQTRGTDPLKADTDGDGLDDGSEIKLGTSPLKSDSDGDEISDSEEKKQGTNPLLKDTDKDGVDDKKDLFPLDPTEITDRDGDGKGDNSDPDDDNDGQSDAVEKIMGTDPQVANAPPALVVPVENGAQTTSTSTTTPNTDSSAAVEKTPASTLIDETRSAKSWFSLATVAGGAAVFSLVCSVIFWAQSRRRDSGSEPE